MTIYLNKNKLQEYTARISRASKTELVVITFELIIKKLEEAIENFENKNNDSFVYSLKKAQQILAHKIDSLDFDYKISYDLLSIYLYVNNNINKSITKLEDKDLLNSISVLNKLKLAFEGIKDFDKSGPVMENTQTIYAGLTYGKDSLNELSIDYGKTSRGYTI